MISVNDELKNKATVGEMMRILSLMILAMGCGDESDTGEVSTDTQTETQSETNTETETSTETVSGTAVFFKVGVADVTYETYSGTEEWVYCPEDTLYDAAKSVCYDLDGPLDAFCRVLTDVESTAVRTDCKDCNEPDWITKLPGFAFDLEVSNAQITAETGPGCSVFLSSVADLDGSTMSYGYTSDYFGHAQVLFMYNPDSGWEAQNFAHWENKTGEFGYNWPLGTVSY